MKPTVPPGTRFRFQLYVADDASNGALAIANLTAFCEAHLPGRHDIEIVDVLKQPQRAAEQGIVMTPTLLKLAPLPVQRIVGTLGQANALQAALGLDTGNRGAAIGQG